MRILTRFIDVLVKVLPVIRYLPAGPLAQFTRPTSTLQINKKSEPTHVQVDSLATQ